MTAADEGEQLDLIEHLARLDQDFSRKIIDAAGRKKANGDDRIREGDTMSPHLPNQPPT